MEACGSTNRPPYSFHRSANPEALYQYRSSIERFFMDSKHSYSPNTLHGKIQQKLTPVTEKWDENGMRAEKLSESAALVSTIKAPIPNRSLK